MDSHIATPTDDIFQIFNINLIELGGTFFNRTPEFNIIIIIIVIIIIIIIKIGFISSKFRSYGDEIII